MIKNKIAFKLTLGFLIIILITLFSIGFVFKSMFEDYAIKNTQDTLLKRAHETANLVSQYNESSGNMRGFGAFFHLLESFAEARVWITDNKGSIVLTSSDKNYPKSMDLLNGESHDMFINVISGKEVTGRAFTDFYHEPILSVGVPIKVSSNEIIGSVFLHSPIVGITDGLKKVNSILTIGLIFGMLLAIGLGFYYSLNFTKPLKKLNLAAIKMTQGEYDSFIDIKQKDEIGQLATSFNQLSSHLGYTIDQLFQEKGKLKDILASINEGIVAFDEKGNVQSYNNSLLEIMNYNPDDEINIIISKDFNTLEISTLINKVIDLRSTEVTIKEFKNKKLRFTLSPISNNTGTITGCVALIQDISESEKLENMRREFVANVSHEFRTPLTIIRGSVEALLDGTIESADETQKFYKRMLSETRGLERLVGDLLDLTKLQYGKININYEKINLPEVIEDVSRSFGTLSKARNINISLKTPSNVPPIWGDYDRLRQLFLIFIDNAYKYSQDASTININIEVQNNIIVTISDAGAGIAQEDIPYIFDRFYKGDKSRTGHASGTGLGLAIAKQLIELHKGTVSVSSQHGIGTTFSVSLPYTNLQ